MPALIERPKMSLQMWAALKNHIMRERERKKQEQEADEAIERLRREQELKRKQDAMTLEEIKDQVTQSEKKLKELKDEKHQLFMQLKKVLHEDDTRRRALDKEASEVAAAQAAAAASHAYANHQALGIVGGAGQAQPLYIQSLGRTPVLYKMTSPQSGTAVRTHSSSLKRPHSPPSPPLSSHPQTGYQTPQFTYKAQVTAYGSKLVPYPTVVTSGTSQQSPVYYTPHHIIAGGDSAGSPIYNAAAYATQFATHPSTATELTLKQHGVVTPTSSSSSQQGQGYTHISQQAFQKHLEHGSSSKGTTSSSSSGNGYGDEKFYVQTSVIPRSSLSGSLVTGQPVVSVSRQVNGTFAGQTRHQYTSQSGTRFY
uniref:Putative myosin class ii heavy chain n=1 Tax=Hyalomma excavatum TaxID=257692 RepID=A0A131XIK9_9ACAR